MTTCRFNAAVLPPSLGKLYDWSAATHTPHRAAPPDCTVRCCFHNSLRLQCCGRLRKRDARHLCMMRAPLPAQPESSLMLQCCQRAAADCSGCLFRRNGVSLRAGSAGVPAAGAERDRGPALEAGAPHHGRALAPFGGAVVGRVKFDRWVAVKQPLAEPLRGMNGNC